MPAIEKVAVIGSGVMGSGIAAVLANAGLKVRLLDIVPKDAAGPGAGEDRNKFAKGAIEKQLKANPSGFTHKENAKRIVPGNLEDDLGALAECDWIIEVVLEDPKIKHDLYRKIEAHRKEGSVVSSNTSTLPLHVLIEGQSERFAKDFVITHFFNPPRFLPLLEVVGGEKSDPAMVKRIAEFADRRLGRGIVWAKDTPGFIANRIGVFWLMMGLLAAIEQKLPVEEADAIMGKPLGIPKTGVFGLFDLIGIDLMPLIAKEMLHNLPESDAFATLYREPERVKKMLSEGYTGRKGKGGFYRMNKEGGKKVMEVIDLQTGEYHAQKKSALESVGAAKAGLAALVNHKDAGGAYARKVLVHTLVYTASLLPEIAGDILNVDEAMRLGYNWKYGMFELIDRLGTKEFTGSDWLIKAAGEEGLAIPPLLEKAAGKTFYKTESANRYYLAIDIAKGPHPNPLPEGEGATAPSAKEMGDEGEKPSPSGRGLGEGPSPEHAFDLIYKPIPIAPGTWTLADVTRGKKPLLKNASAQLWDLGDGVAGFTLTTKANTFDNEVLSLIEKSVEVVAKDFRGLVIGTDAADFSFGANLGFFLYLANLADWKSISNVIKQGQRAFMALKYAPFPVVTALAGRALGGGCEINLHADAVQAHVESYPGLVEVGVGILPGWGGCKEMLLRHVALQDRVQAQVMSGQRPEALMPQGPMPAIAKVFETIALAKVAMSAEEARDMQILNPASRITPNRKRLWADAKARVLELAEGYAPPEPVSLHLPGPTGKAALLMALQGFADSGKATPHDVVVGEAVAEVLTGGDTDITEEVSEQRLLDLEHDQFMRLVKTKATLARIEQMLETGKPLRN